MNKGPKSLGKLGTLDALVRQFAAFYGLTVKDARAMVRGVFSLVKAGVEEAGRVHVNDFGVFYAKRIKSHRIAGLPDSPLEGEMVRLPASVRIGFRAAKAQKRRTR